MKNQTLELITALLYKEEKHIDREKSQKSLSSHSSDFKLANYLKEVKRPHIGLMSFTK